MLLHVPLLRETLYGQEMRQKLLLGWLLLLLLLLPLLGGLERQLQLQQRLPLPTGKLQQVRLQALETPQKQQQD